jgi:uncharacterized protein YjiS (DUF1127 family)
MTAFTATASQVFLGPWRRLQQTFVQRAEQRRTQREAARQRAALAGLDARTLRDLGFGDWAAARPEVNDADLRRALEARGW